MSDRERNKNLYDKYWDIYETGMEEIERGNLDKAWCVFYKTSDLLESIIGDKEDKELSEIQYKMLLAIRDIQDEKKYYAASNLSSDKAEKIRKNHLMDKFPEAPEHKGMNRWLDHKALIEIFLDNEEYDMALFLGEETVEELETLSFDQRTIKDRKILFDIYQSLIIAAEGEDNMDGAEKYREKAEDLEFIYDF